MASVKTSRRGHGEDSSYFGAEKNRYVGAVSLDHGGDGKRVRRKVYGKTKQDIRLKLKTLRTDKVFGGACRGGPLAASLNQAVQRASSGCGTCPARK